MSNKIFEDKTTKESALDEKPVRTSLVQAESRYPRLPNQFRYNHDVRNVMRPRRGHDY